MFSMEDSSSGIVDDHTLLSKYVSHEEKIGDGSVIIALKYLMDYT